MSELVACVAHGDRFGAGQRPFTTEPFQRIGVSQGLRLQIDQARGTRAGADEVCTLKGRRPDARVKTRRKTREGVIELQIVEALHDHECCIPSAALSTRAIRGNRYNARASNLSLTEFPMPQLLVALLLMVFAGIGHTEHLVTTDDGDEIPVRVFPADGERLAVWLSSEFGVTPRRTALAEALAGQGVEVWAPDLHAAWFLPAGRYSLNEVDPAVVGAIIESAIRLRRKRVFLMAEGRTVALALNGVRRWQTDSNDTESLRGLLAFSPRLFLRTPHGAEAAEYLPVAAASNLPVYILQPEESGGFWRMAQDIRELEKGGSPVFVHRLPGVSDGFHARPEFSDAEAALSARLPDMLTGAMAELEPHGGTPSEPAPMASDALAPERPTGTTLLRPYAEARHAPALRLPILDGARIDLTDLKGKVVLVNFWATWCPPCVEEIPSLQRLYRRLQPQGLEILAVDVGESAGKMRKFLADKPIDFPVLMDTEGDALRRWGIYAFPTTLVLDREHRIRYAVFGAFDWSSQEVIDTLAPLLANGEPTAMAVN